MSPDALLLIITLSVLLGGGTGSLLCAVYFILRWSRRDS